MSTRPSFGIMTAPSQVTYGEVLKVWEEADGLPEIEHAWLFDHLMPIFGDPSGPIFEGWTLLSALAARTTRLRLGLLVTSNRFRPPAMLAKIAATVDVVSDGRLDFGIGAGSRPVLPMARREYDANGLPYHDAEDAVASLDEALTIITRLWTDDEPFDFDGAHHHLSGAFANPKPVQRPRPPIMIGGLATPTLRVVARHADLWNFPGAEGGYGEARKRMEKIDRFAEEEDRDPGSIIRSTNIAADYDHPEQTRQEIEKAREANFTHFVISLRPPYRDQAAEWLVEEVIKKSR